MKRYDRVDEKNVLVQETRKSVYDCIRKNPGIHLNGIACLLSVSYTTVNYHVKILNRYDLIAVEKNKHYDHLYVKRLNNDAV